MRMLVGAVTIICTSVERLRAMAERSSESFFLGFGGGHSVELAFVDVDADSVILLIEGKVIYLLSFF